MLPIIKSDLYRYNPAPYSFKGLLRGFRSQGFTYLFWKRLKDNYGTGHIIGWIARWRLRHFTYKYGFQVGGKIGGGFYIGHFGTVIVSVNTVIGSNCNISPGVTIGASRRGEKKGAPMLGDFVWIGTNAVIVGAITIGSDVLIAPGAYVNFDVPDHSIVIGNPGRIIPRQHATDGYINNSYTGNDL
ncbi:MAG: serine acetyltransferase [Ferruginibacter sp.]